MAALDDAIPKVVSSDPCSVPGAAVVVVVVCGDGAAAATTTAAAAAAASSFRLRVSGGVMDGVDRCQPKPSP